MKPIAIFPGHVGKDTGAAAKSDSGFFYCESVVNFAVAIRVVRALESLGYPAQLYCGSFASRVSDSKGSPLGVSIHCDSIDNKSICGFHVMHYPDSVNGEKLAIHIHETLQNNGVKNARSIHTRDDLAILRDTSFPCVRVESGFLTNPDECERLHNVVYQEKLAMSIVTGIVRYLND